MEILLNTDDLEFLGTLNVLYVEDEENVREELAHFLRRRFARLDVAANGREGLNLFREVLHDVVIADIKMPVMDGLTMASEIKSIAQDVPIIVVTAYGDADILLRAIEAGVDRYIKKPVNPNELIKAIQKITKVNRQCKELEKANQQLLGTYHNTIGALARAIEIRDPYTNGHQKRVSQIATAMALEMGLPHSQATGIRLGAAIHDIGKISIPFELLTMPRKLKPLEFEFMKIHPQAGAEILLEVEFPWPIAEMIRQHHERQDGSGYPLGLTGDKIILEARIISVADVFDAMTSHRPYRPSLGVEAAVSELKVNRGARYDADAVDCCLKMIERSDFDEHLEKLGANSWGL